MPFIVFSNQVAAFFVNSFHSRSRDYKILRKVVRLPFNLALVRLNLHQPKRALIWLQYGGLDQD
jgi:hypothetical protein